MLLLYSIICGKRRLILLVDVGYNSPLAASFPNLRPVVISPSPSYIHESNYPLRDSPNFSFQFPTTKELPQEMHTRL